MTTHRKNADPNVAKARAEAVFRKKEQQRREGRSATDDYAAKHEAERDKTAKLKDWLLRRRRPASLKGKQEPGARRPSDEPTTEGQIACCQEAHCCWNRQDQRHPRSTFWEAFNEIAAAQKLTLQELVTLMNRDRQHANLSSAIRLFVLDHYRRLASEATSGAGEEKRR